MRVSHLLESNHHCLWTFCRFAFRNLNIKDLGKTVLGKLFQCLITRVKKVRANQTVVGLINIVRVELVTTACIAMAERRLQHQFYI